MFAQTARPMSAGAVRAVAAATRRFHPRGVERLLHRLHDYDRRQRWSIVDTIECAGSLLHVDTASYIEWVLFFTGAYEPEVGRLIPMVVRDGHDAIDLGANIGVHTLRMARAAGAGRVLAVEPNPDTAARLVANLELNGSAGVVVERCAVGAGAGHGTLFVPDDANRGMSRLTSAGLRDHAEVPVDIRSLDQLAEQHGLTRVDLVKIDVEGFEPLVITGGKRLLERQRPTLIFEYNEKLWTANGHDLGSVVDLLRQAGYELFFEIHRSGLRRLGPRPSRSENLDLLAATAWPPRT
jgi:FkbM family methyltransferase